MGRCEVQELYTSIPTQYRLRQHAKSACFLGARCDGTMAAHGVGSCEMAWTYAKELCIDWGNRFQLFSEYISQNRSRMWLMPMWMHKNCNNFLHRTVFRLGKEMMSNWMLHSGNTRFPSRSLVSVVILAFLYAALFAAKVRRRSCCVFTLVSISI
jgi:hypothetical protein